jgi:hypothetical protein
MHVMCMVDPKIQARRKFGFLFYFSLHFLLIFKYLITIGVTLMFVYGIYQVNYFKIMYEIHNNVIVTNHYRFMVRSTDFFSI